MFLNYCETNGETKTVEETENPLKYWILAGFNERRRRDLNYRNRCLLFLVACLKAFV